MKIKETHSDYYFRFKKNVNKLYQKKIFLLFIILTTITVYSLSLIYYGMGLQKMQVGATLQQIIFDGSVTRLNIIPNYFKGLYSKPDEFSIDLNFKDIQKLNYIRENSLRRGKIIESDKILEVNANLTLLDQTYKVKLSPTGMNLDMIGNPNKYAYKVSVKNGDRIYGMKEFKLIPPKSRHHLVEWIGHKIEKSEGLITLRYNFIDVIINGDSKGIYAIEEHFNKELIENNNFREGIIFSLSDDNDIIVFNEKRIINDKVLNAQLQLLQKKWQAFLNNDLKVEKIFDQIKYAKFFAIVDLMDGYHATLKMNLKMYLNPVTNLIEPIAREYNSLRYSDGPPNSPLMIERVNKTNKNNYIFLFTELSKELSFIKYYLNNLSKFSKKEYLDKLFKENEEEINEKLNIIYKDEPYYSFPKDYMYIRQKYIINKLLNQKINLKSYYNTDDKRKLQIKVLNQTSIPIELLKITDSDSVLYNFNNYIIKDDGDYFSSIDIKYVGTGDYKLKYHLIGLADYEKETILIPRSFNNDKIFPDLLIINEGNIYNKSYLKINNNIITFTSSNLVIADNLVIPKNYKLIVNPGQKINLINNASILTYSPIELIGNNKNPILIYSSDSTGQGIVILNTKHQSIFDNVIFSNISNPKNLGWELSGSITIYESNIAIKNSTFKLNRSEDYINIIRSKYEISECLFQDTPSDAFDGDFSDGIISNTTFRNCGNDAIDLSGSDLTVDSVFIDNAHDKGISVGEYSKLRGQKIKIQNSEIGITSKDNSVVEIDDIIIENTKLGFTAYQKKPEYGPGKIIINKYYSYNVENNYLIEEGSSMTLESKYIAATNKNVENMLYGEIYGKNSDQ